jgi:subtilisin family serine protease
MKCLFVLLMAACLSQSALAAEKVIVRLQSNVDVSQFKVMGQRAQLEALVPELGIYAIVMPRGSSKRALLPNLRAQRGVVYAQEDHPVTMRKVPNDKSFSQQWDMKLDAATWGIDALGSWAGFGQGGLDPAGNEVVVAVVDGGVDVEHLDLVNNIWVNNGEIAANGIDDDGNGYIDDVNGWNAYSNIGDIDPDDHGTHVSGTIGAVGNNALGIAGINWNTKVMAVK